MQTFGPPDSRSVEDIAHNNSSIMETRLNDDSKYNSFKWFYFVLPFEMHIYNCLIIFFISAELPLSVLVLIFLAFQALKIFSKVISAIQNSKK